MINGYILRRKPIDRPELKTAASPSKKDDEAYLKEYLNEYSLQLSTNQWEAQEFDREIGLNILKTLNSVRWELLPAY
tara:strand:- start:6454 stop:6684 length:231 start_codon:yes stop_codon:yes gene_type:complete